MTLKNWERTYRKLYRMASQGDHWGADMATLRLVNPQLAMAIQFVLEKIRGKR